jgi:hypothetical protein
MRLPNVDRIRVDREKITEYLLNLSHPDGASKARFFIGFGFRIGEWDVLGKALIQHGIDHPVERVVDSAFGTRYTVVGPLETPDGRDPHVRSVWILDKGSDAPRLVTAHPA